LIRSFAYQSRLLVYQSGVWQGHYSRRHLCLRVTSLPSPTRWLTTYYVRESRSNAPEAHAIFHVLRQDATVQCTHFKTIIEHF